MMHKNWKIEEADYGYYSATNLEDCDAPMKYSKSVSDLIVEIDELKKLESRIKAMQRGMGHS